MKMLKFIMLLGIIGGGLLFSNIWQNAAEPMIMGDAAIANVNGTDADFIKLNMLQTNKSTIQLVGGCVSILGVIGLLFMMCSKSESKTKKENDKVMKESVSGETVKEVTKVVLLCMMMGLITSAGCRRFDKPEYQEISTSETAFLIKLEGKDNQTKFDSAEKFAANKVAAKRIQITHRWNQTGRLPNSGSYIPEVLVVKVDRAPVTVEWESGGEATKSKDMAIWTESADSVGFSLGWSCSAYIKEENAATFLYMYPSGSLKGIMNTEIRARIQQIAAEVSAKYKLDELRDKKMEIATAVQTNVIPFFETRGITITTVGMFGGMTYENSKIQDAIDQTFIAQQEKVNSKAMLDAQEDKNKRIESEAKAKGNAAEAEAKGIANGNLLKSKAEAEGIEAVNKAIALSNPMLLQLKTLDVEKIKWEKWAGKYPDTVVGEGANIWVGLPQGVEKTVTATTK